MTSPQMPGKTNGFRQAILLAASLGSSGCAARFAIGPPPTLPEAPDRPPIPAAEGHPTGFTPTPHVDLVGGTHLGVARRSIGVAPVEDADPRALERALIHDLLVSGVAKVVDLSGSGPIFASYARSNGGGDSQLFGRMPALLEVAPIASTQAILVVDSVVRAQGSRGLPVERRFEADQLSSYEAARGTYEALRTRTADAVDQAVNSYEAAYGAARDTYESARPFWQKAHDQLSPPAPEREHDAFSRESKDLEVALRTPLPTPDDLTREAAASAESKPVAVYTLALRARLVDTSSGGILAVAEEQVEDVDAAQLVPRASKALVDALVAR